MITTVDNSELTAEQRTYEYREGLENLVDKVANALPLLDFKLDKDCIAKDWNRNKPDGSGGTGAYDHHIYRVKVFQDGELLGALESSTRYNREVGRELVYGIESFRISKERGKANVTYTKDMKVALRTAKKTLVARESTELKDFLVGNVGSKLRELTNSNLGMVRYGLETYAEAMNYVMKAYDAHLEGKTEVMMPVKLTTVSDMDNHYTKMERFTHTKKLLDEWEINLGYAIKVQQDGTIVMYSLAKDQVRKFQSFDDLPTDVASKLAMFKVLEQAEAYSHLGAKLSDDFFYIAE